MMNVSPELREFLKARLSTFEQVEILLLLMKDPSRSWSAPEVASELKSAPESAAMRLFLLASSGLVIFEPAGLPRYRYGAPDAATATCLRELETVYARDPGTVTALFGQSADPVRSFAEAFRLKK